MITDAPLLLARFPGILLLFLPLILCSCAADGGKLFHEQGCIQCHRFQGAGGMMGPDLTAVADRRSDEFIAHYIHNPKASNPRARMPAFSRLSKRERMAIIAFLKQ
jgi:cytochrome c2